MRAAQTPDLNSNGNAESIGSPSSQVLADASRKDKPTDENFSMTLRDMQKKAQYSTAMRKKSDKVKLPEHANRYYASYLGQYSSTYNEAYDGTFKHR